MLSSIDKKRIREEMLLRHEIMTEIKDSTDKPPARFDFNSPFVVTVIGGIILASLGSYFQQREERQQLKVANQAHLLDQQLDVIQSLNDHGTPSLLHLASYCEISVEVYVYTRTASSGSTSTTIAHSTALNNKAILSSATMFKASELKAYTDTPTLDGCLDQAKALFNCPETVSDCNAVSTSEESIRGETAPVSLYALPQFRLDCAGRLEDASKKLQILRNDLVMQYSQQAAEIENGN